MVWTKTELHKFFKLVCNQDLYQEFFHRTLYEDVWNKSIRPELDTCFVVGKKFWGHLKNDVSAEVERCIDFILKCLVVVNRDYLTTTGEVSKTLPPSTSISSKTSESSQSTLIMQLQYIVNMTNVTQTHLQDKLVQKIQQVILSTDQLVLDDLLRTCHQWWIDMIGGALGALVLYSIPDGIFPSTSASTSTMLGNLSTSSAESSSNVIESQKMGRKSNGTNNFHVYCDQNKSMKRARQRIIKSIDPALESVLFQPGGLWEALPMGGKLREYLKRMTSAGGVSVPGEQKNQLQIQCITECDSDAIATKLSHDIASHNVSVSSEGNPGEKVEKSKKNVVARKPHSETIEEALSSTLLDIFASNMPSTSFLPAIKADKQQAPSAVNETDTNASCQNPSPLKPTPPETPFPQFGKLLHRTTVASILLFLYHLRSSPTTRKAWWSVVQFSTSMGILGVAVGTGVASRALESECVESLMTRNPVFSIICSSVWGSLPISTHCSYLFNVSCIVEEKLKCRFLKMMEELKQNKHLRLILAIMIIYGVRRLPRSSAGSGSYSSTVGGRYTLARSRRDMRIIR